MSRFTGCSSRLRWWPSLADGRGEGDLVLSGLAGRSAESPRARDRHGLGVPDVAAVVTDGPVGGEIARARGIQDRHPGPPLLVGPGPPDGPVVAVDVGPVVCHDQVLVPVEDRRDDVLESPGVPAGESTRGEGVDGGLQLGVAGVTGARGVTGLPDGDGLFGGDPEQEEVVGPDPVADLDVGAVERADGDGAVEGQFHVAGAGGLLAGQRDLLRDVAGRHHELGDRDVVVGNEHDLDPAGHVGVGVDHGRDRVDQLDDPLGLVVARRGLGTEDDRAGRHGGGRVRLDPVVQRDDVEQLEELALVLVQPLGHDVEQRGGVDGDAGGGQDVEGQVELVLPLHLPPLRAELRVVGEGLELPQPLEVGQPSAVAQPGRDQAGQPRVGQPEEPARADAVRHVPELLRPQVGEVPQHRLGQQPRVQFGHAVDGEAAEGGQVGHPHPMLGALLDQRHPRDAFLVTQMPGAQVLQEGVIQGIDDFQVAGQQPPEQRHRPGLEGLGQQGVAGVGEGAAGDGPGLLPADPVLVDQQPHELGYRQHRVGVVELDDDLVGECRPVGVAEPEPADDVPQRARDQEILLLEPQFPAGLRAVAGVEHLGEVLRAHLRLDGFRVPAGVEQVQVERLPAGPGAPQPDDVDRLGAEARHQHVAGLGPHRLARHPARAQPALVVIGRLGVAVEPDHLEVVGGGEFPRVAVEGPVVGVLDLIAVLEGLLEDPELVPDAVAHGRQVEGGHGVEQAGGQTAQAAVPQTGLDVEGLQVPGREAGRGGGPASQGVRAGVHRILAQLASQHVLRREVIDELRVGRVVRPGRPGPAVGEAVADGHGQCPVRILGAGRLHGRAPLVT